MSFLQSNWKDLFTSNDDSTKRREIEVITVDGEKHEVRKRSHHTLGANHEVLAAAVWVRTLHRQYKFIQKMKFLMNDKMPW